MIIDHKSKISLYSIKFNYLNYKLLSNYLNIGINITIILRCTKKNLTILKPLVYLLVLISQFFCLVLISN